MDEYLSNDCFFFFLKIQIKKFKFNIESKILRVKYVFSPYRIGNF